MATATTPSRHITWTTTITPRQGLEQRQEQQEEQGATNRARDASVSQALVCFLLFFFFTNDFFYIIRYRYHATTTTYTISVGVLFNNQHPTKVAQTTV